MSRTKLFSGWPLLPSQAPLRLAVRRSPAHSGWTGSIAMVTAFKSASDLLATRGWAHFSEVRTTRDLLWVARSLGTPVRAPSGDFVRAIRPVPPAAARSGTLSALCGLGAFPFHTDTAFWPTPCRFLVMRVVGDRRRTTDLLDFDDVWASLDPGLQQDALSSVWRTRRPARGIYCSMRFTIRTERGWRYDPAVMEPANASALRIHAALSTLLREPARRTQVQWAAATCLVIDNWRCLHARGPLPSGEALRVLERIYVE